MKILVISDLHGDIYYTKKVLDVFSKGGFDKLYVLGDIKYESIKLLNEEVDKVIIAVCGNCDQDYEIDYAKFNMPLINYDYAFSKTIVLTHSHIYDEFNYNGKFDIMLKGHLHISSIITTFDNKIIANPGSIALPRDSHHSYMTITDEGMKIIDINTNEIINELDF